MKINVKWNMPNMERLVQDATKKVEVAFNADLNRLQAGRTSETDEQMTAAIRSLAARHGVTLDAETLARLSKAEQ